MGSRIPLTLDLYTNGSSRGNLKWKSYTRDGGKDQEGR